MRESGGGQPNSVVAEFAAGWPIVLGAVLGIGVGVVALPTPLIGFSMSQWQAEFGWTRTQISLGPLIIVSSLALTAPIIGWVSDRIREAWIAMFALAALAIGFMLFRRIGPDVRDYYVGCAALALSASGASTLIYARVISAAFVRGRGLALGIAMTGNGLTGVVLPLLMVPFIAEHGWRSGFKSVAVLVLIAVPVVGLLLSRAGRSSSAASMLAPSKEGVELSAALRMPLMWWMVVCFALISLAAAGIYFHFVAFLTDAGMSPQKIGTTAGMIGVSLIVSRIVSGFLLDRFRAPYVAAIMMIVSAIGIAALAIGGSGAAILGAWAIGLAIGCEIDLIGYFTARYFGMRAYGRIYGIQYSACLVGGALSPLLYGAAVDASGSYRTVLLAAALVLIICAGIFVRMRPIAASGFQSVAARGSWQMEKS